MFDDTEANATYCQINCGIAQDAMDGNGNHIVLHYFLFLVGGGIDRPSRGK